MIIIITKQITHIPNATGISVRYNTRKHCCRKKTAWCRSCSLRFKVRRTSLRVAKLRKSGFRALNMPAKKQNVTQNGHSGSFKATCFGDQWKGDKGQVILYNDVGYFLRSRRSSARKHWQSTFSITPLSFDAPLQGTPENIRINFILWVTGPAIQLNL